MFCRKCGKEIHNQAVICVHCGCETNGQRTSDDKYCKICGAEITETTEVCMGCGCKLPANCEIEPQTYNDEVQSNESSHDKSTEGFLLAFFLGLIGLIIGVCLYPSGSQEAKTFLKSWLVTTLVLLSVGFLIALIVACATSCSVHRYYY